MADNKVAIIQASQAHLNRVNPRVATGAAAISGAVTGQPGGNNNNRISGQSE